MPSGADAEAYADITGIEAMPVTADPPKQVLDATPWDGAGRPGKCALSPDMVILTCYTGEDDTQGFDAIRAHAGI